MKIVAILFSTLLPFVMACTVYQSDGRKKIEKNTANIVSLTGFDDYKSLSYTCFMGPSAPTLLHAPSEVLESDFEVQGFSSLLVKDDLDFKVLVYKQDPNNAIHHHCLFSKKLGLDSDSQAYAIRLGVNFITDLLSRIDE